MAVSPPEGREVNQTQSTDGLASMRTTSDKVEEKKLKKLVSMALELGCTVQKTSMWEKLLVHSIRIRLRKRLGEATMQSVAFSLPGFPLDAAEVLILKVLEARLNPQHTLRLEEELRGSRESVQALQRELQAFKEDALNRERLAQAELNHLRQQVERAKWEREGFSVGAAVTQPAALGESSSGGETMAQAIAKMGMAVERAISRASTG